MGYEMSVGNIAMDMGTIYEPAIREATKYKLLRGLGHHQLAGERYSRIHTPSSTFLAGHEDWLVVHPDCLFLDAYQIGQFKRHDPRTSKQYGDPSSHGEADNDIIPVHELIQCQIELACVASQHLKQQAEWRVCWLACEFGDSTGPRLYRIVKNPALIRDLLAAGQRFWREYMRPHEPKEPSDADWSEWMGSGQPDLSPKTAPNYRIKLAREDLLIAPVNEVGTR